MKYFKLIGSFLLCSAGLSAGVVNIMNPLIEGKMVYLICILMILSGLGVIVSSYQLIKELMNE